ncbi:MAG: hypothetical protein SPF56_01940 [Bacteroidaceae bacterium]|nr:hypothetical protein [Prevotellaceae bacterium]MDY5631259.1 hypothetical protein [Bacteroidaceae bacterium]
MKKIFLVAASAPLLFSGCAKLGNLSSDDVKVNPTPLVATAGQVPATISVTFPEKYMKKKAVVTCIPVLQYQGGRAEGQSATFQGEKVEGNATTVNYKIGGVYNMKTNFRYTPEMLKSDLLMTFDARIGKKQVKLKPVKIGYGVLATSDLLGRCLDGSNAAIAPDNFQRVISQKQEANIKFLIAQSKLRTSELQSVSMKDLVAILKEINNDQEGRILETLEVSAYASPDGRFSFNEQLAQRRQKVSAEYLRQELKKIKMNNVDINTKFTAEDWEGFQELIQASSLQDKQVILSVLSMYKDPEQREQQIRNMSEIYTDIKEGIMPELRRARLIVNYEVIGRSDEQIMEQYQQDAKQLSVEELVYAATTLEEDPAKQQAMNERITQLYPNDYRAYNNLAALAYQRGDYAEAGRQLKRAKSVLNNAAEANANQALLALREGKLEDAETFLAQGSAANTYNETLGLLNVAKGNYPQAAQQLKGSNTNAQALAELLSDDLAGAAQTLAGVKNADATTAYLQAILAARKNDASGLVSSLKKATQLDPSLAQRALNDLEFANFTSTVAGLVK